MIKVHLNSKLELLPRISKDEIEGGKIIRPDLYDKILSEFSISIINMSYDNLLLPLVLCFEEISVIVENDIFKKI